MMTVICDLDGVVYRGDSLIGGSDTALRDLARNGFSTLFVTNNSTKTPADVVAKLGRLTGVEVPPDSIVTSSQAAASMLAKDDSPAYVLGSRAIEAALEAAGIAVTTVPEAARAVVVGMDWALSYQRLSGAVRAAHLGARLIATNSDPTFPTEDGFMPGSGAIVAAVETASGMTAEVAGKPHTPILALLRARGIEEAWVIGDRVDTDMAMAERFEGWRSILVLSGVTAPESGQLQADHIRPDLRSAVDLVLSARDG